MKLVRMSCKLDNGLWELENLELSDVNLLVGKNATGKSRTIYVIDLLVRIITQERVSMWLNGEWQLLFENKNGETVFYTVRLDLESHNSPRRQRTVTFEKLVIGGTKVVLDRSNEKEAFLLGERIHPPIDKLVLQVQRDREKYPFFEEIVEWAELSFGFKFTSVNPQDDFLEENSYGTLMKIGSIPTLYNEIEKAKKQEIINICAKIGYSVEGISVVKFLQNYILYIREKGVSDDIPWNELSQGMLRSLSVIIYIEYLLHTKQPTTIIIDDLCEGLDYDRATKLGKWVFETCKGSNVQLIATSNDSFLMDVVDINYWNVLQREGSKVTAISAKTHPELFEKFKFTGLSNFDFFASDYIHRKLSKTPKND